jgi:hypothetical protein
VTGKAHLFFDCFLACGGDLLELIHDERGGDSGGDAGGETAEDVGTATAGEEM